VNANAMPLRYVEGRKELIDQHCRTVMSAISQPWHLPDEVEFDSGPNTAAFVTLHSSIAIRLHHDPYVIALQAREIAPLVNRLRLHRYPQCHSPSSIRDSR
jgi:hypothetical protein